MTSTPEYFPPPSGPLSLLTRSVAMLRHEPEQLEGHAALRFQPAHDDLDLLDWAEVVGISGKRYALVRHRHSPTTGTEIVTNYDSPDPRSDIRDVLLGLNLSEKDLVWTAPDVVHRSNGARALRARKSNTRPRVTRMPKRSGALRLRLKSPMLDRLRRPVRGRGGFQSLLRKLQTQLDGTELQISPEDVERLLRYSADYGTGGFQQRTHDVLRKSKAAAKKR